MKYRQPGYRDQDYKEEREKRHQEDKGPRGPREPRGMAREARLVTRCYQCGHQESALDSVPTVRRAGDTAANGRFTFGSLTPTIGGA